jgi:starch synthase
LADRAARRCRAFDPARALRVRVLFVTSECHPLVKTGGLGDVAGALPGALGRAGVDVRVLLPAYRSVLSRCGPTREIGRLPGTHALPEVRILETVSPVNGAATWLVDAPTMFDRDGGPYVDAEGRDWPDNHLRFGCLCHAAFRLSTGDSPVAWRPDLVHCHDWQAGLAPAYLALSGAPRPATIMTIHNLAFQGIFPADTLGPLGLPPSAYAIDGVEFYGRLSFLKGGLFYADHLTTVSPTYAREIQAEELGFGMQGLLAHRAHTLTGITNGIDAEEWNPAHDRFVEYPFDARSIAGKRRNRESLLRRFGLDVSPDLPLVGMVGRLTYQKGVDLVPEALSAHIPGRLRLVVLGSGDRAVEDALRGLAARHPASVAVRIGYDEALAHQIEASADLFLMPSRFEPCGLNQMYSQRYGTPPIVRGTGGLADTVTDPGEDDARLDRATGFVFRDATPEALARAVDRAIEAWRQPAVWQRIQRNGMDRDFGWDRSAAEYARLYARVESSSRSVR